MDIPADRLTSRIKANWLNLFLAVLAFAPLLWNFFILSWNRPAYQFFPMALVAAGMLAWRGAEQAGITAAPGNLVVTRLLMAVTAALCLTANLRWSPWLGFIAFLAGLVTVIWGLGGKVLLKALAPALLIMLAILPPPLGLDEKLTLWLRSVAVQVSCSLMDWMQIILVRDGNTVQLPGKALFVEEACSGINSFILCNVFCLFWFLWQRRPLWWLCVSLPAVSVFVVLGNILRITICAAVYNRWQIDLLEGWRHETFGLVLLLGYCALALSLDQFMVFLLYPADESIPGQAGQKTPAPTPFIAGERRSGPLLGFKFAGAILFFTVLGICGAQVLRHGRDALSPLPTIITMQELKLSLPANVAGWNLESTAGNANLLQTTGVHTMNWLFRRGAMSAEVAVDYPFGGFHDVRLCYENNGWKVINEEYLKLPQTGEDLYTCKLILAQAISHAIDWHSDMDQHGNWISKQKVLDGGYRNLSDLTSYRIQLIAGGYAPVMGAEENDAQDLFFAARALLAPQMIDQFRKDSGK
jgi:exosortase